MCEFESLLVCPLSLSLFYDPVIAADGFTYEREAIERRIKHCGTSPKNDKPLTIESLRPNLTIKDMIERFEKILKDRKYQYVLNVEVKKRRGRPIFQTTGKSIYQAEWLMNNDHLPDIVLLKVDGARATKEASFYVELSRHPNIVRTFGLVENKNDQNAIYLLQEYASEGSLYEIISDHMPPLEEKILLIIFSQITDGMRYLASKHVVHGDLACRNVLVFRLDEKDPSRIVVKVTDFGLSRHSRLYLRTGTAARTALDHIPIRYAAPEILSDNLTPDDFSEKSDVFSFGVLMWEAFSRCAIPWGKIADDRKIIAQVMSDQRLTKPEGCSEGCWSIMKETWLKLPDDRPTFNELRNAFKNQFYLTTTSPTQPTTLLAERAKQGILKTPEKNEPYLSANIVKRVSSAAVLSTQLSTLPSFSSTTEVPDDRGNKSQKANFLPKSVAKKSSDFRRSTENITAGRNAHEDLPHDLHDIYLPSRRPGKLYIKQTVDKESPRVRIVSATTRSARTTAFTNDADNPRFRNSSHQPLSSMNANDSVLSPEKYLEKEVATKCKKNPMNESPRMEKLPKPFQIPLLGRNRGIEGDRSSSAINTTVFTMFGYTNVFDELLELKVNDRLAAFQAFLRTFIVDELRQNEGFVERDVMHHFGIQLDQLMCNRYYSSSIQNSIEVLQMFQQLFGYTPLKITVCDRSSTIDASHVTKHMFWPIYDTDGSYVLSTTTGTLFRKHLFSTTSKLITIPPFLILLAPKHSQTERSARYIVPDRTITLDDSIVQLVCYNCLGGKSPAQVSNDFYVCQECCPTESLSADDLMTPYLCRYCLTSFHSRVSRNVLLRHKAKKIKVEEEKMNLFAVICVENSHHTSFVKCHQNNGTEKWLVFEYIRDTNDDGTTVPCVTLVDQFDQWLIAAEKTPNFFKDLEKAATIANQSATNLNDDIRQKMRLFRRGVLYFYERSGDE